MKFNADLHDRAKQLATNKPIRFPSLTRVLEIAVEMLLSEEGRNDASNRQESDVNS